MPTVINTIEETWHTQLPPEDELTMRDNVHPGEFGHHWNFYRAGFNGARIASVKKILAYIKEKQLNKNDFRELLEDVLGRTLK